MLTNEELINEGINVPSVEENSEMADMPQLNSNPSSFKQSKKLFSKPLFVESFKSSRVGLAIISIGNALIMMVLIIILSTLNINSTSKSLKNLFSNADYETTLKTSSIFMYSTLDNSADAYLEFNDSLYTMEDTLSLAMDKVDDKTLNAQLSQVTAYYNQYYASLTTGTDEEKDAQTKSYIISYVVTPLVNADSSMSDDEKNLSLLIISNYYDFYAQNKEASQKENLVKALPLSFGTYLGSVYELDESETSQLVSVFNQAFQAVFTYNQDKSAVCFETSLGLIKALASDDESELINNIVTDLTSKYNEDKVTYLSDTSIQNKIVSSDIQNYVFDTLNDYAYYNYLPDFTVNILTSDAGYPIKYEGSGKYTSDGKEILKEVEIKSYSPDEYIAVEANMGAKANLLEKMHKDVITGSDYSEEEVKQAKEDAVSDLNTIKTYLSSFMDEFITLDENGTNKYFDGENIVDSSIMEYVADSVSVSAKKELIKNFNENNDTKITSIDEITKENNSMSGDEMMNLVNSYVYSGIASYKSYYQTYANKGYSNTDSMLLATVKGSKGVIASLPDKVNSSLTEMGEMNTYGIMTGYVGFAIAALLIPMVYTIMLSNNLVASKVETGSLAFTLSTPIRRISFVFTQGMYLLFSECVMAIVLFAASAITQSIGVSLGGTDLLESLPISDLALYTLGNFAVTLAISGICFFASCFFDKSNQAIAIGGGLNVFFYICSILGLFGTKAIPGTVRIDMMNYFNYVTINSLFDPLAIMNQDYTTFFIKVGCLLGITLVTYIAGMVKFTKKDLPL